ncbi:fumarylacetoacetate hydrolase family protein [Catenulispora sp. NF23]|uniref:Fumarylacetoacetate hydrolase family protein n=1 Tax=Catenulispora pinistramenti TaxID=2705254 RepID=A0ABS5KMS6_9ACTN|nr:fumarylacetoacetate hydrolase family protein [Catenulispora pinistramenti]MBS2531378.1 fumarylacetoacetate hydrolase family protein [Catenulispora pinistramenti]MBS2547314.1 fumarylacetoacetate hydrolase family protein [Catenulispora pinistramenti]
MRIANLDGRLVLKYPDGVIDVEKASDGRFAADPQAVFARWDEFVVWADRLRAAQARSLVEPFDPSRLKAPVPRPSQVFAIGLNYADHVGESRLPPPPEPAVFTKFPTCLAGPGDEVKLPTATVDWEAELVVVIGRRAVAVQAVRAWDHVAGVTVGQDLSERTRQLVGTPPQFSIGKSFPGFAPIGPEIVTPDELADREDLEIGCSVNGEVVQRARTSQLIFSVAVLIERLSAILPLTPGDIVFTGTPSGVGHARSPQRYLAPGDVLETWISGVGRLRNTFAEGPPHVSRTISKP